VASNSIRATVELMMDRAALKPYLDLLISNQDVAKAKPDPEMYNITIQRLGLQPRQCLVVEDNQNASRRRGRRSACDGRGQRDGRDLSECMRNIARAQRSAA